MSPDELPEYFEEVISKPFGEEEYLTRQGVPIEAEANRRIRDLERPVKEFSDQHSNSVPALEEVAAVLPALQALQAALSRADADGVHPKQQDCAWVYLTAACDRIARIEELSYENAAGAFARMVLLETSRHAEPMHHPEYDAQFDDCPSWGSPAARIESAQGLILLARHANCATAEVLQAIERLSTDPVPAVRFQIAAQLHALYRAAPELMWQIVEYLCREEPSRGVLQGFLSGEFGRLASAHPDRVASLVEEIFDRVNEGPSAVKVRELCIEIFTGLYVWRDHALCREIVLGIAADPIVKSDEVRRVLRHLREPLTHGPIHPSDPNQDAVRRRAFDLIACLLRSASDGLRHIKEAHADAYILSEADQKSARALAQLIDDGGVFLRIGRVVRGGQKGGYQYESPAADLMVRLVERYLAEYRVLLREDEKCRRALLEVLDLFVQAGWPSARRLTYRLEEIFR